MLPGRLTDRDSQNTQACDRLGTMASVRRTDELRQTEELPKEQEQIEEEAERMTPSPVLLREIAARL